MKIEQFYLKLDSRHRISLKKLIKDSTTHYKAYTIDGKIILEPVIEEEDNTAWIFKPENEKILKELKKAVKQKGTIDRGSFTKYIKE